MGIDPGKRGAIAVLNQSGNLIAAIHMPRLIGFCGLLSRLVIDHRVRVFIEKAQVMANGEGSVSMFNYGRHYGTLIGAMEAHGIAYAEVPPQEWTKAMHASIEGVTAKEKSRTFVETQGIADRFIPEGCRVPHDGMVDAYLIGLYGYTLAPASESCWN